MGVPEGFVLAESISDILNASIIILMHKDGSIKWRYSILSVDTYIPQMPVMKVLSTKIDDKGWDVEEYRPCCCFMNDLANKHVYVKPRDIKRGDFSSVPKYSVLFLDKSIVSSNGLPLMGLPTGTCFMLSRGEIFYIFDARVNDGNETKYLFRRYVQLKRKDQGALRAGVRVKNVEESGYWLDTKDCIEDLCSGGVLHIYIDNRYQDLVSSSSIEGVR